MLRKFLPILCVVTLMLPAGFASARNDDKINSDPTKSEFIQLCNGKDLTGWVFSNAEVRSAWTVENGVLVNKLKLTEF